MQLTSENVGVNYQINVKGRAGVKVVTWLITWQNDPCWNNPCSHICIPASIDPRNYVCTCPVGYVLMKDRRTCIECEEEQYAEFPFVIPEAESPPYGMKGRVKGGVKG